MLGGDKMQVMLTLKQGIFDNKSIDYRLYALTNLYGKNVNGEWTLYLDELVSAGKRIGLSSYKIKKTIDLLEENKVFRVIGPKIVMYKIQKPFVTLKKETVKWFLNNNTTNNHFKVYCYLLNSSRIRDEVWFSKRELLRRLGYSSENYSNRVMVQNVIEDLESLGLIKYNHVPRSIPRVKGLYHELLTAKEV